MPDDEEVLKTLDEELFTVQDVVRYLVSLFSMHGVYVGHGTDNYWDEALEMVQAVMFLQPPCDDSTLTSRLTRRERHLIGKMAIARTRYRIPTPYLTHRAFFAGHQFYVDRRVIIPRSPIAELIDNEFHPYLNRRPERVLDMCTGSGCIAIAIALQFEGDCEVDAVDISADALEVAARNIEGYELENLVTPIQSDLFDNLPEGDRYDLIVANPPYVNAEDISSMPDEYHREPELALGSGADGLDCVRRILLKARDFLTDEGILIVEVGNTEENLIEAYPNVPFHFIDLKKGGSGVFMLTADQLELCAQHFVNACNDQRK
ncbi:50S ribosomal protein L3 N(5)-glutamine methyltransferase [Anaerobiospirillum sp. NML120449]|uniref:50S ribosomal protein L3 N(5)-glutamine methyltransferase n=1 Tax=Anaerobiospirillum sp. NML120449 TaxID=2932817 RepID=UPI001FF48103|nr:50S ribosomal protein L3 N(5)-glutamine methyltransferase [Anaerobiospirillum sp. NML120449]MCK0526061.1 50S ribosomal protein L3 N(5)-glutamine methyltransferase [Anaerobiospirillum sp. NML120449]